jgi:glycosyltransferase involved in cell wall biosynthesis
LRAALHDWERGLLGKARWVLTPTRSGRCQLAQDLALDPIPAHWRVLSHPRPALRAYERATARARLGWSEQSFQVIGVGMYLPLKRFDRLIDACAACAPDLHLTLIGDGDARPLRERAERSGLRHRLTPTASDDIGLYLSAADLYVSTSATESFGMANLEALIAGVPCICSPVGAVPEVVGDAALLVEPDPATLARAIKRLRVDGALREQLRRKAAARAAAWPDALQTAELFLRIIEEAATDAC